jgi:hypothetical protein
MGFLSEKQKQIALDLVETGGQYAKELNEQIRQSALGNMDRKGFQELGSRVAAINAQVKAGMAMIAGNIALSDASELMRKIEGKSDEVALLEASASREAHGGNGRAVSKRRT